MSGIKFGFTADQLIEKGRATRQDLNLVKTWLAGQNLPELTDEQVVIFLLSCRSEPEATKATIAAFYAVRSRSPEVFNDRRLDREDFQQELKTIAICLMPERTDSGHVVIHVSLLDSDYSKFNMTLNMMHLFMVFDAALHDDPPEGFIIIYEMQGMGLKHLTRMRVGLMRTYFQYLQEGLPLRLQEGHMMNSVWFVDKMMALFRPLIKKEIFDMAHFHRSDLNMEQFHKDWVPKRCLPQELGGDLPSIRVLHEKTVEKLTNMQSYFDAEERQRRTIG